MLDAKLVEERIEPIEMVHVGVREDEAPDVRAGELVRQVVKRIGGVFAHPEVAFGWAEDFCDGFREGVLGSWDVPRADVEDGNSPGVVLDDDAVTLVDVEEVEFDHFG